jgi:hypothetical protein
MGFLFEAVLVLEDELREGNIPAQAGVVSFVERCFNAMPPSKSTAYLRSDSAYYQAGVINLCIESNKLFTITADQDRGVKENIETIREWRPYHGYREIGETIHGTTGVK